MKQRTKRTVAVAVASTAVLGWTAPWAHAACTGGPDIFECTSEADYLAKIGELGYSTIVEGFEDDAIWGTVRSTLSATNSAPSITSQGITWTANHAQSDITTGMARRTGQWGLYDPDHGFATGSTAQCDIDNPPEHCLWYDGFTGTRVAGEGDLYAAGAYIRTSTVGANPVMVIDDDDTNRIDFGKLSDTAYHFFGVVDTRGFTRFQFKEIDGKIGQKFLIFGDDFTFASSSAPVMPASAPAKVNHNWTWIDAPSGYGDAVVLAGPPTSHGDDPGVVRMRNISDIGFELRFQEWDYRARDFADTGHVLEDIPYVVAKPGRHLMSDGSEWEVGTFSLGGTGIWHGELFSAPFGQPPHLFLTVQTYNGVQAVSVRARNVSADGFEAVLFEEEALMDGHATEVVGYLAVESPAGGGRIDLDGMPVPYLLQSLSSDERWSPVLSQRLRLEEEKSKDGEVDHTDETLHVLALGDQVLAQQVTHKGADTAALRRLEPTKDAPMEWGLLRGLDHNWQTLPFAKTYTDPVVVAKPASNAGSDPGVIRVDNLGPGQAQLRYQEWDYLDGQHGAPEDVFYLVSEAGQHSLGGLTVEADWLISNKLGRAGRWEASASTAVLLRSQCVRQCHDLQRRRHRHHPHPQPRPDGLRTRHGRAGIQVRRPHQRDARLDRHRDRQQHHQRRTQAAGLLRPNKPTSHHGVFPSATNHRIPTVVGDVDSTYGGDPVFLRYANPTNAQIELKLSEEQSLDAEVSHVMEDIGVFIGE